MSVTTRSSSAVNRAERQIEASVGTSSGWRFLGPKKADGTEAAVEGFLAHARGMAGLPLTSAPHTKYVGYFEVMERE